MFVREQKHGKVISEGGDLAAGVLIKLGDVTMPFVTSQRG